jgi:hypothetical protein
MERPAGLPARREPAGFLAVPPDADLDEIFRNAHEALRAAMITGPDRVEIDAFN